MLKHSSKSQLFKNIRFISENSFLSKNIISQVLSNDYIKDIYLIYRQNPERNTHMFIIIQSIDISHLFYIQLLVFIYQIILYIYLSEQKYTKNLHKRVQPCITLENRFENGRLMRRQTHTHTDTQTHRLKVDITMKVVFK